MAKKKLTVKELEAARKAINKDEEDEKKAKAKSAKTAAPVYTYKEAGSKNSPPVPKLTVANPIEIVDPVGPPVKTNTTARYGVEEYNSAFDAYLNQLKSMVPYNTAMSLANHLKSNEMIDMSKLGFNNWNDDTASAALLGQNEMLDYFRKAGYFDRPEFLSREYITEPTTSYLTSQEAALKAQIEESKKKDDQAKWYESNLQSTRGAWEQLEAEKNNPYMFDPMYGYAMMEYLQGNREEPFNFDQWDYEYQSLPADQQQARLADLQKQWNGLDFDTLTGRNYTPYQSKTGEYQSKYDTVSGELARRSGVEAFEAEIRKSPNYGKPYVAPAEDKALVMMPGFDGGFITTIDTNAYSLPYLINNWRNADLGPQIENKNPVVKKFFDNGLHLMSKEQTDAYNAAVEDGGEEYGQQYLDLIIPGLHYQKYKYDTQYLGSLATNDIVGPIMSAATVPMNMMGSAMTAIGAALGEDDPYAPIYGMSNTVDIYRGERGEVWGEKLPFEILGEKAGRLLYNIGMSTADMVAAQQFASMMGAATGNANAAKNIMGAVMSTEVGTSTFLNDLQSGRGYEYAVLHGFTDGFISRVAESGFLDNLFSKDGKLVMNTLKAAGSEGLEEMFEEGGQIASDAFFSYLAGQENQIQETYNYYAATLGADKAALATLQDFGNRFAVAGLSGAVMGGGTAAAANTGEYLDTRSYGKDIVNNGDVDTIMNVGQSMPENSESKRVYDEITGKQGKGKKPSFYQFGQLTKALVKDLGAEHADIINRVQDEAIVERLVELGEDRTAAKQNASIIRRIARGEKVPRKEAFEAKWSDNATQVVKELSRETKPEDVNRAGNKWIADMEAQQLSETSEVKGKQLQVQVATVTPIGKAANRAEEAAKKRVPKRDGKPKLATDSHVTFRTSDGNAEISGDIMRFEDSDEGMQVVVQTGKGKEGEQKVKLEDWISADGDGVATILSYIGDEQLPHSVTAEEANTMMQVYKHSGGNAKAVIQAFDVNYLAGYSGADQIGSVLDPGLAKVAYEAGKAEAAKTEATRVERAKAARKVTNPTVGWIGDVSDNNQIRGRGDSAALDEAVKDMSDGQRYVVEYGKALAQKAHINVVFFNSKADPDGKFTADNGRYDPNTHTIYLDINAGLSDAKAIKTAKNKGTLGYAMMRTLGHEVTHAIESTSVEYYAKYKQAVKNALKAKGKDWATLVRDRIDEAIASGQKMTYGESESEIVADASEYMLQDADFSKNLDTGIVNKIKAVVKDFVTTINDIFRELAKTGSVESYTLRDMRDGVYHYMDGLQELWGAAFEEMAGVEGTIDQQEPSDTAQQHDMQSSPRVGYTSDGIAVYKSNFPEGSTQPERQARVLDLVQNVWAKNPIALEIVRNGKPEQIVAQFDPWVDPEGQIISDATKLAFGNRKGTKSDRKTTQKLADDFPEIIASSHYDRPGNEIGKTTYPHEGVLVWHYFANRIGFINDDGGYAEYNVSIDVKEKTEGHYVYSVAAVKEKGSERNNAPSLYSSPGTMNAPVSGSGFSPATAVNTVPHAPEVVNSISETVAPSDGIEIDTDTGSAYPVQSSARTWRDSDYVTKREEMAQRLSKSIDVPVETARKWIDDVNSISTYVLANKARVDYIPTAVKGVSAFKSNPEYGGSIDMSTICAKRRLATGTLDAIQRVLGDEVLTKDDFLRIREMMKERGHEVACGLCFVESSRKNLSKYNAQFMEQYNRAHPDGEISMTDLNTVDGLEALRLNNEDAYAEYEKFMNKLAQRKPKLFEKRTEYNHEILKKFRSDTTVDIKNLNGGLRLQSFSDFEIVHLIDMMQVITDMASVGLAGQAYTKVPDFAWVLGDTGLKINLSLIAKDVDADGNLIFDDVEGMNHNEAKKLRDAYSKNVGTIVVTFTDEQLLAAMKSDMVDYIIPFHRSQWQKGDYKKLGLPEGTKDYTLHQNEKQGRKRVKENLLPNAYWDFTLSGKQNAEKYLSLCAASGRTPKFAKFLVNNGDGTYSLQPDGSTDGYWKLLIDFKMYDNQGNGSPQLPVQPNFNMNEAMRMLKEYKGEHDSFPVAQDVVDDFVKEYRGDKGGVQMVDGRYTLAPVQSSARRNTPDEFTTRDYLAESDDSIAETVEERNALTIYQKLLKDHAAASEAVMVAEQALETATEPQKAEARKVLSAARAKQRDLYNRLLNIERTAHVQSVISRTNQFMTEELQGKTRAAVEKAIADREAKIAELKADLTGLKGAAKTQREADIRQHERIVARFKSKAAQIVLENSEKYQRQIADIRLRRDINIDIGKKTRHIKRVVKALNDRIVHEDDYKNVKEPLKPAVHTLVRTFLDGFGNLVFDQKAADKLKSVYDVLAQDDATVEYYDDEVSDWLTTLAKLSRKEEELRAGGSTLESLNDKLYIYTTLSDIADHVAHMVTAADTMFMEGRKASVSGVTEDIGNTLLAKEDRRELAGALGKAANFVDNLIIRGNMMPQFFFEGLNNNGMMQLYDGLQDGVRMYSERLLTGENFLEDAMRRYGYHTWRDMDKAVEFKTQQGHTIHLKRENMMWIYATAKREASNPLMDTHHLDEGGFVYEESSAPTKGLFKAKNHQQHHKIVQEDVEAITAMLTAEQIAFMDECVEFLSTECADWGNEASMQLFGIKKYKEKYYFPFKVDGGQLYKNSAAGSTSTTSDARVKHISFSHSIKKGANTPLVMGEFTSVIADHINQMATYSGLVVPIENMNRVLNRKVDDDGDMVTIRSLLGRKHGSPSSKYVDDLLKDLNGGPQTDNRGTWDAGIRLFKKNAVVGKMSVAVQQPMAITRAFAYINPRWFVNLHMERPKETWDRMMKYSGTAVLKDMGGFNVGLGQGAKNWIERGDLGDYNVFKRSKFLLDQKGFKAAKDEWVDFLTGLPGWMDKVTWISIWNAAENEQAHQHPGMDRNSDEFLQMVGRRFDDIVNHTQVYDSILSKSQNMRSKNTLAKMATSFMAESTLNMNLAYRAFASRDVKQIGKVVSSLLLNAALGAAAYALVGSWNKDDDDRTWEEKYAVAFAGRLADNLNPMASIPYLSDIWNKIQGYDVERTDLSYVLDLAEDGMKFFDKMFNPDEALSYRDYENFVGGMFAAATGIPAKNWMGDARRIWNMTHTKAEDAPSSRVWYGILDEILPGRGTNNTAYYERLLAATMDGDKQEMHDLKDYLMATKGVKETSITSGVRDAYKKVYLRGGVTKNEAVSFLLANSLASGKTEGERKQSAFEYVDKWEEGTEGYSAYNTLRKAFSDGNSASIQKAWDELEANGWSDDSIGSYVRNTIIKGMVTSGQITPSKATELIRKWYPYKKDSDNINKPKEWLNSK